MQMHNTASFFVSFDERRACPSKKQRGVLTFQVDKAV